MTINSPSNPSGAERKVIVAVCVKGAIASSIGIGPNKGKSLSIDSVVSTTNIDRRSSLKNTVCRRSHQSDYRLIFAAVAYIRALCERTHNAAREKQSQHRIILRSIHRIIRRRIRRHNDLAVGRFDFASRRLESDRIIHRKRVAAFIILLSLQISQRTTNGTSLAASGKSTRHWSSEKSVKRAPEAPGVGKLSRAIAPL